MIKGFDGLRALAVMAVLVCHAAVETLLPEGALRTVAFHGFLGVDVFFALSGFLITHLLLSEEERSPTGAFSLRRFYVRRALRILPAFFFFLLLSVLVLGEMELFATVWGVRDVAAKDPGALVSVATFTWNYYASIATMSVGPAHRVTWSLCVEEHFYLLWPLAMLALRRRGARVALVVVMCAAALALRAAGVLLEVQGEHLRFQTHYRLDAIGWGALMALLWPALAARPAARRCALGTALVGLTWFLVSGHLAIHPHGTSLGLWLGQSVASAAFALVVLEVACTPTSPLTRALELRPLRFVGRVSYGVYLLHHPGLDVAGALTFRFEGVPLPLHFAATVALTAVVTIGAAALMYVAVERPFLRLKDRFAGRAAPQGEADPSTATSEVARAEPPAVLRPKG